MTKAGVIANTLGNLEGMLDVCDFLLEEQKVNYIFHLGNYWVDVENFISIKRDILEEKTEYTDKDFLSDVSTILEEKAKEEELIINKPEKTDPIKSLRKKFVRIKGLKDPLSEKEAPNKRIEVFGNKLVLLASTINEVEEDEKATVEMVFLSEPQKPVLRKEGEIIILSPGHLDTDIESPPSSFVITELKGNIARFTFYSLSFKEILKKEVSLKGARFSAR